MTTVAQYLRHATRFGVDSIYETAEAEAVRAIAALPRPVSRDADMRHHYGAGRTIAEALAEPLPVAQAKAIVVELGKLAHGLAKLPAEKAYRNERWPERWHLSPEQRERLIGSLTSHGVADSYVAAWTGCSARTLRRHRKGGVGCPDIGPAIPESKRVDAAKKSGACVMGSNRPKRSLSGVP